MNPENYPKQDSIESRIIRPIPIFSRKTHSFFVEPRITNDSTIHLSIPKKKRIQKNKAINIRNTSHLHVDKQPNQEPQENKDNREDKSPVYLSNKLKIFLSHNEYMSDESRWKTAKTEVCMSHQLLRTQFVAAKHSCRRFPLSKE